MTTGFPFPLPGHLSIGPNGVVFTPTGGSPVTLPNLPFSLPNLQNLSNLSNQGVNLPNLNLPQSLPSDLSNLAAQLAPVIISAVSAAVPGGAALSPLIGVLFQVAHALSTQMHATASSGGTPQSLQLVHDAFWQQVLGVFGQKPATSAEAAPSN